MIPAELVSRLRAAGDPLYLTAADALAASLAELDRLRVRIRVLEAVARLNGETIRSMQRASAEAARAEFRR
jgi:hypothetical protein